MKVSRLSVFGNAVVFALLAFGAWLWWRNVSRTADPPSAAVAILAESAEKVGVDSSRGAPRRTGGPAGPLVVSASGLAIPVAGISADELTDTYTASRGGGSRVHNAIDIMAPRGTPDAEAADWAALVRGVLAEASTAARLADWGAQAENGDAAAAAEWMRAGRERWGEVVRTAGMRLE